ncbi:MAG: sigma-70 family RNA polymerase sigma factor [Acidimicrobiia bacterium]
MSSSALVVAPASPVPAGEVRLLEIVVAGRRAAVDLRDETSPQKREELESAVRGAEEARGLIIQAHQGLVAKLANRYRHCGVPMADLMQEGNIGLLAALDRFDPAAGRFASFAWFWVRQMILAAIPQNQRGFCLSYGVSRQVYRVRRVRQRLETELGREPSRAEVSVASGLSAQRVAQLETVTLPHQPLNEMAGATPVDLVDEDDPQRVIAQRHAINAVHDLLNELPARERLIIRQRYGLGMPHRRLADIAETLGVSASRICQIEGEALQRLRRLAAGRRDELLVA